MAELMEIRDYVWTTAKVIGSVLKKEVVICDSRMYIVGDSKYDSYADMKKNTVTNDAILRTAMQNREVLTINNVKEEAEGCSTCENLEWCDINSIIAFPIIKDDVVIGCIGLYSDDAGFQAGVTEEGRFLIDFIWRMSELLISKLEEKNENLELKALQKRLSSMIEHLDTAVAGIDGKGRIIHTNSKFWEIFGGEGEPSGSFGQTASGGSAAARRRSTGSQNQREDRAGKRTAGPGEPQAAGSEERQAVRPLESLKPLRDCPEFLALLQDKTEGDAEKELQFLVGRKKINVIVTVNHIEIDGVPAGTMVYFKNTSKLYEEINRVSNSYTRVTFDDVIGNSQIIRDLKEKAEIFSKSSSTILIQGESGTGKEIFSRAIHSASSRCDGPFVAVNCAAIPDNLLESELFGYEEGAFTGAAKGGRIGKFQLANNGTLFLDEVGEMPIHLQVKLLRAIQEKKIQKIGGSRDIDINIRIIAATNKDLERMIESGEFREDLFYRLNVIPVTLPALRERRSDIPVLLTYFLDKFNDVLEKNIRGLDREAQRLFYTYDWPGNIRELQNTVEYCVNMAEGPYIRPEDLPRRVTQPKNHLHREDIRPLREIEQFYIQGAVSVFGDTYEGKEEAARALGIGIATLYRKLKNS